VDGPQRVDEYAAIADLYDLGWAQYYLAERKDDDSQMRYGEIAKFLAANVV
jgi:hypothetical protein